MDTGDRVINYAWDKTPGKLGAWQAPQTARPFCGGEYRKPRPAVGQVTWHNGLCKHRPGAACLRCLPWFAVFDPSGRGRIRQYPDPEFLRRLTGHCLSCRELEDTTHISTSFP